jgi:hypothetical protein
MMQGGGLLVALDVVGTALLAGLSFLAADFIIQWMGGILSSNELVQGAGSPASQ